jgi:hypothetical protein
MTTVETLNTKLAINELSFLLVTHTSDFDAGFDCYGILKSGQGAEKLSGQINHTGEWSGFGT